MIWLLVWCERIKIWAPKQKISQPIQVDLELTLDELTKDLLRLQKQCAPFGADNPKPIYLIKNVIPKEVVIFLAKLRNILN